MFPKHSFGHKEPQSEGREKIDSPPSPFQKFSCESKDSLRDITMNLTENVCCDLKHVALSYVQASPKHLVSC